MILVVGGTGTVGSEVVRQLLDAKQPVRVLLRDPGKLGKQVKAEAVRGDLNQPESLVAAMQGVEKVFLVTGGPQIPVHDGNAINAAKQAGVKHVVKLSAVGAEQEPGITLGRWHRQGERVLIDSGLIWTILRPVNFMSNALLWIGGIKKDAAVSLPLGEGRIAVVDPRDIAAVAVRALTSNAVDNQALELTGPQLLSAAEQVHILSDALGKNLKYIDVPPDTAKQSMLKAGAPEIMVNAMMEHNALVKAGYVARQTASVEKVTGRKPGTFAAWATRHVAAFQ